MPTDKKIISVADLSCIFGHGKKQFAAIERVSFDIADGETVSIVGESGSGKTTLARMLLGLQKPTSGQMLFDGNRIGKLRNHFRMIQAVFQDPFASFNQFFTIKNQLADCFRLLDVQPTDTQRRDLIDQALISVNLDPAKLEGKYPFELSGGQMQRLLLARIVLIQPRILIADEPTSMIDACSRATILDLLTKLRTERGMTIIYITHDIGLAYYVSDRVFIMRKGSIVEQGTAEKVILDPSHDYTKRLLADIPVLHREWISRPSVS